MTKSRLIGKSRTYTQFDKSGIFTTNDLTVFNFENRNLIQKPLKNQLRNNFSEIINGIENKDPYNNHVMFHIPGPIYDTHILKDQSGNNFDEFLYANDYRNETGIHESGPNEYFSTHLWANGYTVADAASLRFGTSNFTIEFWMKTGRIYTAETYIMGKGTLAGRTSGGTGWVIYLTTGNLIGFYDGLSNTSTQSTVAITHDTWTHIAIVRSGTAITIYQDGVSSASAGTAAGNFTDTNPIYINQDRVTTSTTYFGGYLFDLRIKTSAVYTANFSRPTDILDMTGSILSLSGADPWHPYQTALQKEGLTITASAGNYDVRKIDDHPFFVKFPRPTGSGVACSVKLQDRGLQIADKKPGKSLAFGTSAFTVECWVYVSNYTRAASYCGIAGKGTGNGATAGATGWSLIVDGDGQTLKWSDGTSALVAGNVNLGTLCWNHVAAVREGTGTNQFKMYVNGQLAYTGTLATNYTQTEPLIIGASRNHQYPPLGNRYFGFKISSVARYTGAFTINKSTFFTTTATTDANTLIYMIDTLNKRPRPLKPQYINDGYELITVRARGTTGQHRTTNYGLNAGNFSLQSVANAGTATLYAQTSAGSFSFGSDFSIEFWICTNYEWERVYDSTPRMFLDCRTAFNDAVGFALRHDYRSLQLICGGQVILSDTSFYLPQRSWSHICIQRTGVNLALYVNGDKRDETSYTGSMGATTNNKLYLGNGAYGVRNDQRFYGWMSDIRIVNGTSAYGVGSSNPDQIEVPNSPVSAITNTTLLISANSPILKDSSSVGNAVWAGNRGDANFTSSWDVWIVPFGPYNLLDRSNAMVVDAWDGSYSGAACEPDQNNGNNRSVEGTWLMRLTKAWTIEGWIYLPSTNPASISVAPTLAYTSVTASANGWNLVTHYAGTGNSFCDITFTWRRETAPTLDYLNTSGQTGNLKPNGWNHVAVVYNPAKTNIVAIFVNGLRVAARTSSFTAIPQMYTYDRMQYGGYGGVGDMRVSDIARYDNDQATYTIPTSASWVRDINTSVFIKLDNNLKIYSQQMPAIFDGLMKPSYQYTKWGNGSIAFGNYNTGSGNNDHFFIAPYGSNWAQRVGDTRYGDFTVEGWAQWKDATAGGRATPSGAPGACIFHFSNYYWVGINTSGNWTALNRGGATTNYTPTLLNTIAVATSTAGTWDYWCFQRKDGDYTLYVNGIIVCRLWGANHGTYGANGPTASAQSTHDDFYDIGDVRVGYEYNDTAGSQWCGHLEDFRYTGLARYETVIISGVPTQCHNGTRIPAMPTAAFPRS